MLIGICQSEVLVDSDPQKVVESMFIFQGIQGCKGLYKIMYIEVSSVEL